MSSIEEKSKVEKFRKSDEIRKEIAELESLNEEIQATRDKYGNYRCKGDDERHLKVFRRLHELKFELRETELYEAQLNLKVGDGVTCCMWSDKHAYTVIKRTAKTITIQRDKAILSEDFRPEIIPGGFAGYCVNQDKQTYTYERNPNGKIYTCRWSDRLGGFKNPYKDSRLVIGRHEFYDYNF